MAKGKFLYILNLGNNTVSLRGNTNSVINLYLKSQGYCDINSHHIAKDSNRIVFGKIEAKNNGISVKFDFTRYTLSCFKQGIPNILQ